MSGPPTIELFTGHPALLVTPPGSRRVGLGRLIEVTARAPCHFNGFHPRRSLRGIEIDRVPILATSSPKKPSGRDFFSRTSFETL